MPKTVKTPATVLQSLIDEYQINPFSLSKNAHIDYQSVRKILSGQGKVTVPTALKLSKYFGQSPVYWIDIQAAHEINTLTQSKKFMATLDSITKAQKPTAKTEKTVKRKSKTLSEKRKKAVKVPGARGAKRSRKSI